MYKGIGNSSHDPVPGPSHVAADSAFLHSSLVATVVIVINIILYKYVMEQFKSWQMVPQSATRTCKVTRGNVNNGVM